MFGKIQSYLIRGQQVEIEFEHHKGFVEVINKDIIRIFANFDGIKRVSKAIENNKTISTDFSVTNEKDYIKLSTLNVIVFIYDDFKIDFYDVDGKLISSDYKGVRKNNSFLSKESIELLEKEGHKVDTNIKQEYGVEVVKNLCDIKGIYGLGDKTGFLNKLGYSYEMWNTDNPDPQVDSFKALYKSIPFFVALSDEFVYGIFFDTTYHSYFDMGKESSNYYYFAANQGDLDYYYIAGNTMSDVISNYSYLTGTSPLPQLFTLGYQQSRWGYESEEEVRYIAKTMRENKIPCDTIHLDIDYMDSFKVFTWNKDNYSNAKKMISDLSDNGFKVVTIIDPGVKMEEDYYVYEEGIKNGYFVRNADGTLYNNVVWPGESVYPDFGVENVRNWWAQKQKYLLDMGVRGVWNDMNEPASFNGPLPDDILFKDEERETNHLEMHNVYGHNMAKATYEGLKEYDNRRPFIITRACFAGTQKYSTAWTGDNHSIWAHLQMAIVQQCNLTISGMSNVGTDVGGFGSDCTGELMVRWVQAGCFSPFFRNHSSKGTKSQEPWQFGKDVLDIYRKYVELRYSLIPYFYDLFYSNQKTGLGIIRPLVLHYQNDVNVRNLNDEFLVGENILVSPVVTQGQNKKMVYLPKGIWYDYHTCEKLTGEQYIIRDAPLDICPIFVKAGSIIPSFPIQQYVGESVIDTLILETYKGEGTYIHYQDDGETFRYEDGEYNLYRFEMNDGSLLIKLIYNGYKKVYKSFIIKSVDKNVQEVKFNDNQSEILVRI